MKSFATLLFAIGCTFTVQAQYSASRYIVRTEIPYMGLATVMDINGDGAKDMVVGTTDKGLAHFMNDGAQHFGAVQWDDTTCFGNGFGIMLASGDMDGDGDLDVIGVESGERALFFSNDGGILATGVEIVAQVQDVRVLQLEDMNGDGALDVVLNDYYSGTVMWYEGLGDGTVGAVQAVFYGVGQMGDIDVADLDGDGDLDVAMGTYNAEYAWYANDGSGVFGSQQAIGDLGMDGGNVECADLDGDGDLDVLGGSGVQNMTCCWMNNGGGTFGATQVITNTLDGWYSNVVADMDGDGDQDIIPLGEHPFTWLENDGTGQFPNTHYVSGANIATAEAVDVEGDGDLDVFQVYGTVLSWYPNEGSGVFGDRALIYITPSNVSEVRAGDIDGDGDEDVIWNFQQYEEIIVYQLNDGDGSFGLPQLLIDTLAYPQHFDLTDLDGDGDLDLGIALLEGGYRVLLNDGAAHFALGQQLNTTDDGAATPTDLDGDGDPDLALYDFDADLVKWRANDGSGTFGAPQTIGVAAEPMGLLATDVDSDGDQDLMTSGQSNNNVIWFENNGLGSFAAPVVLWSGDYVPMNTMAAADVNGDGLTDLVYPLYPSILLRLGLGGGAFAAPTEVTLLNASTYLCQLKDVDADGDPDLFSSIDDPTGLLFWQENDGAGNFSPIHPIDVIEGDVSVLCASDLDGDGDLDIAASRTGVEWIHWYESYAGSIYHIQGDAFFDEDQDGLEDPGEDGLPFVLISAGPNASTGIADDAGSYDILVDPGTFTVSPIFPNAMWALTTLPVMYQVTVDDLVPVSTGNDFGYAPLIDTTILVLGINANAGPCATPLVQALSVTNLGTTQPSGTICYTLDSVFTFLASVPPPTSVNGNMYCWEYDSLFFYTQQLILITVDQLDPSTIGLPVECVLSVTEEDGQGNVVNTLTATFNDVVACSYDPNDKQVLPQGYGDAGAVELGTEFLDFRIRFQNTGNAPAANVTLTDQLSAYLDPSSMQVIGYSHPLTGLEIGTDGELVVRFEGIQLPDSGASFVESQGFFSYRMRLLPGLPHGTVINNTANIYFDYNPPVITNTTTTTLVDCSLWSIGDITSPVWNALQAPEGDAYQWYLNGTSITGATDQILFFTANGEYTVDVTSEYGCVATSEAFNVITSGVNELPEVAAAAIPNPFTDHTDIVFSEPLGTADELQLVDLNGRVLRTFTGMTGNKAMIEREGLSPGLYMVRVLRNAEPWCTVRVLAE